jgi:hypothetical protein
MDKVQLSVRFFPFPVTTPGGFHGYCRDDDLWDIAVELLDTKARDWPNRTDCKLLRGSFP